MPAIMLVSIGALFIKASQKSSLKCNQDKDVDGVGAVRGVDIELLFRTSALPGWILYCLVEADSGMVVSQFLLFLSSSMGQLSMMLASFPSEESPAFEVIHRASLVVMLLTAHNMAAEALGDDAVLVCLPELVAALVWVTIYLGHRGGSSTVRTVEAVLHKAVSPVIAILSVISAYVGWTWQQLKDEPDGAMKMLSSYWYLLVVCSFSVVLLFLCLFALRQCLGQTKDGAPLSELEGAIKLLRFFCKTLYIAGGLCLVLYPLFFVPLRLKLQGLAKDKWRDFLTATNDVASKIIASLFI